jgi:hypothetical protein
MTGRFPQTRLTQLRGFHGNAGAFAGRGCGLLGTLGPQQFRTPAGGIAAGMSAVSALSFYLSTAVR